MHVINNVLIPSLDEVGRNFENGKAFLPQLMLSAEVSKKAFNVINEEISKNKEEKISKGKIVIATVKGDVHDIGKNIAKVLLENYGYEVIDLGKDVSKEIILQEVLKNKVKLVGLSALMTTTLINMEETIKLIKKECKECRIMAGGAVLTEEYAKKIGADFYAKNAKASVDIARKILV